MNHPSISIANLWKDIFNIIPSIETSFALLAFFGGISVLVAVWFFRSESSIRRERIFIYIILFFLAIVIALVAGLRTGEALVEPQVVESIVEVPARVDESLIALSSDTNEQLERYLISENREATAVERTQVVEKALSEYLNSSSTSNSSLEETDVPETSVSNNSTNSVLQGGFRLILSSCEKDESKTMVCKFSVNNQKEDGDLRIYAQGTQAADSNGDLYDASRARFGTSASNSFAKARLAQDVPINGSLTFAGIPDEINKLNLLDIYSYSDSNSTRYRFQFRDISVVNS